MKNPSKSQAALLRKLGLKDINAGAFSGEWSGSGPLLKVHSPINGKLLANVRTATAADYEKVIRAAQSAFEKWRILPAPKRGEIIRQLRQRLARARKKTSANSSRWKWERSWPKARAKFRR